MSESVSNLARLRSRLWGTAAVDLPQRFEIACECGEKVSGERGPAWQHQTCPACGADLYVLPVNSYPATPSVSSEVIGGPFLSRLRVVLEELLPEKQRPDRSTANQPSPESNAASPNEGVESRAASGKPSTAAAAAPRGTALVKTRLPRINPARMIRRTFTPFRLLMAAAVVVVAATAGWMFHRNTVATARQTWINSMDQVPKLLANDDLVTLQSVLSKAISAGQILKYDGSEWRETINLLQETHVVHDVSPDTLTELLLSVSGHNEQLLPSHLLGVKEALLSNLFVIDGFIDPSGNPDGTLLIDIPVMPGGSSVHASLRLPDLNQLLEQAETARVVFAFRCSDVRLPVESLRRQWELQLAPASFVLMTSPDHCRRLGLSPTEEPALATVLDRQKEFVRKSETWIRRYDLTSTDSDRGGTL